MKTKGKIIPHICLLFVCLLSYCSGAVAQIVTDTIYYNKYWEICEKPVADYYRVGGALIIDTLCYYTGKIKDYTINDSLVMEGEYSNEGYRDGVFNFYYPGGKLYLSAKFAQGNMVGDWQWYYSNGSKEATIHFLGNQQEFSFITYNDEDGKSLMVNGTGDFMWSSIGNLSESFKVMGSFKDGRRSGSWKYYNGISGDNLFCKETYDKNGNFLNGKHVYKYYNDQRIDKNFLKINFIPTKLVVTESITLDEFFKKNGDSLITKQALGYLFHKTPSTINLKYNQFDTAFTYIIRTFDHYRNWLDYINKDIDAKLEFRIGDHAFPENITINGKGLTDREKGFLLFLMGKFRGINMPGTDGIVLEGYHTINIYVLDVTEYLPFALRGPVNREIFFTPLPKEKMKAALDANRKNIKKYLREAYYYFR